MTPLRPAEREVALWYQYYFQPSAVGRPSRQPPRDRQDIVGAVVAVRLFDDACFERTAMAHDNLTTSMW